MCGVFGYVNYGDKVIDGLHYLAEQLGHASTIRGTDATGIAFVDAKGNLQVRKKPCSAYKFDFKPCAGASVVIGHTRHATQGKAKFWYNNHPFLGHLIDGSTFAFAHNGILDNDFTLRREEELPDTKIETDSYIMVQLIEKLGELNFETIKEATEKVLGSFVFTFLSDMNELYIVKGSNPISIIHFQDLKLIVYASTDDILFEALINWSTSRRILASCFKKGYIKGIEMIEMNEGDILKISENGDIDSAKFEVNEDYYRYKYGRYYNWSYAYADYGARSAFNSINSVTSSTTARDILYEHAANMGISKEEIDDLLIYGDFSIEEVEEMLNEGTAWQYLDLLYQRGMYAENNEIDNNRTLVIVEDDNDDTYAEAEIEIKVVDEGKTIAD